VTVAILLLFVLILAVLGSITDIFYPSTEHPSDVESSAFGYGIGFGFLAGVVVFIVGIVKGRKKGPTRPDPVAHPVS